MARSPAPARTCSASGADGRSWRTGRLGPPAGRRGLGLLARRRVDQGRAARPRRLRAADGARRTRRCEFFGCETVEAVAALRLLEAPDQGRNRCLRDRDRQAGRARRRGRARALRARRAAELGEQIAAVIDQTGLAGEFPVGLIGSAFKAGELFVGAAAPPRAGGCAPMRAIAAVEMAPVGGSLLLAAMACGRLEQLELRRAHRAARLRARRPEPRSAARRWPIASGADRRRGRTAHPRRRRMMRRLSAAGLPPASATKKAAANTSPAPRSSTASGAARRRQLGLAPPGSSSTCSQGLR